MNITQSLSWPVETQASPAIREFDVRAVLESGIAPSRAAVSLIESYPECADFWVQALARQQEAFLRIQCTDPVDEAQKRLNRHTDSEALLGMQLQERETEIGTCKDTLATLGRNWLARWWNRHEIASQGRQLSSLQNSRESLLLTLEQTQDFKSSADRDLVAAYEPGLFEIRRNLSWSIDQIESYPQRLAADSAATDARAFIVGYRSLLVHGVHPEFIPQNNSILIPKRALFRDKLLLALVGRESLTFSCSSLSCGDGASRAWCQVGLLIGGGSIQFACPGDAGSVATGDGRRLLHTRRNFITVGELSDDISRARQRVTGYRYNEFGISAPTIVGFFILKDAHHPEPDYLKQRSLEEIMKTVQEVGLPIFVIKNGEVYRTKARSGSNIPVEDAPPLAPREVANLRPFELDSDKRSKYLLELRDRQITTTKLLSVI